MMSCSFVTAGQAEDYFKHNKDYYTKNNTNYDRWHGTLAKTYGLTDELSKEQFDFLLDDISQRGRKRAGLDCTFSAPKSISLAMAKDENTRQDMITAHQNAVSKVIDKIELELLQTRSDVKTIFSRNTIAAEFLHTMARPTKENDNIPDLDLHSHIIFLNKTIADGKDLSIEYEKILSPQMIKHLGLQYRQNLAKELQHKGYKLEITDTRNGFFELKNFNRDTILEFSNRRKEILKISHENNLNDMQKANKLTRQKKGEGKANFEEVCEQVKQNLFENGKVKIEWNVKNDGQEIIDNSRQIQMLEDERGQRSHKIFDGSLPENFKRFAEKSSLSELPNFNVDDETKRTNMLLPKSVLDRLGKFQSEKVRNYFVFCEESRERIKIIDKITADVIKKLSAEKFAFSIHETKYRIMAAGVLETITEDEATKAMEKAKLIKLGQIERNGKNTKDIYLTTKENIEIEQAIIDRVKAGKGKIKNSVFTMEESQNALIRAETRAKKQGLKSADFTITNRNGGSGEQAEAVYHILVSNDQYICVDGLAGTGKTTMMERLKWIADEQGIEIKGVCFTGKAADGLESESGINSTTIHSFLNRLENKKSQNNNEIKQEWDFSNVERCNGREIWAVDEAGLVDMRLMNQLQKAAEARGAQVLLLGDPDQLPPVGAGEPMRQMIEAGMATAHLYDIRRQKDAELLAAVRESVQGDHLKTFETLDNKGCYLEIKDKKERLKAIKEKMTALPIGEYKKNLLLVSTNADRKSYNQSIRAEYVNRGEIENGKNFKIIVHIGEKDRQEKRNFARKDRIIFTANDRRIGVMNGTMATIEKITGNEITARTDAGQIISWNMEKYNSIDYAYAVTNYKAQGMTVEKVIADMNTKSAPQTRNALYVDISRAKSEAVVYTDNKETLKRQTRKFAKKITSKDFSKKMAAMRKHEGISNNDRYHASNEDPATKLEKALTQIEKHSRPPAIVEMWEQNIAKKKKAAELALLKREPTPAQKEQNISNVFLR